MSRYSNNGNTEKRSRIPIFLLAGMLLFGVGVAAAKITTPSSPAKETTTRTDVAQVPTEDEKRSEQISSLVASMTTEEKIAQMLFIGYDGIGSYDQLERLATEEKVGGIMLMGTHFTDVERTRNFIGQINRSPELTQGVLPFIGIDQEGGTVSRLQGAQYETTSQKDITSTQQAEAVAAARAQELVDLGINVNFSPVVESIDDPSSFLYPRTFPGDDSQIASYSATFINQYQSIGLHATAKHFPGHANTSIDSHIGLPRVDLDEQAFATHIAPFTQTLENSSPAFVMMGHVYFPTQDDVYPSSLSSTIIQRYLRTQLGYDGLVITDDLSMGAIQQGFTREEAAVAAINAGNDILLYVEDEVTVSQIIQTISSAIDSGALDSSTIDERVERILRVKLASN